MDGFQMVEYDFNRRKTLKKLEIQKDIRNLIWAFCDQRFNENLLVTSTLTVCTEPYPEMMPNPEPEKATEEAPLQSNSVQNGVESMMGDRDEIMTEVEADIEEMTIDVDAFQEMVGPSEANSTAAENS
ncbi:hypothetical protein Gohar_015724 [Gossypium harknessii]|uniref:Uncharacterized protein n=1 Tax=Gossypium harknessii TaxID=34285 RepID=A0A7J9G0M2_9ROSI|nr:hypothetical protein [Gossypium harknessii]